MRLHVQSTSLALSIKVHIKYWHVAIGLQGAAVNNDDSELTKQMFHSALGVRENTAPFLLCLSASGPVVIVFLSMASLDR